MTSTAPSARWRLTLRILRGLTAFAFISAGILKLVGMPMMVAVFDHVGLGQWFRYVTGLVEVGGAIMLLGPRFAGASALLLGATMVGAIVSHVTVVPGSPLPATILLTLCSVIAWSYRNATFALLGHAPAQRVAA